MSIKLGIFGSQRVSFIDFFTRANNPSSLGSVSGMAWRAVRGVWGISNNKAISGTSSSSYPLATLKFTRTDVTVSVSGVEPGMGASFWVTDGDNWYASVYTQNQVCETCTSCSSFSGGNCIAFNPSNCASTIPGNCGAGTFCCGSFNPSTCNETSPGNCNVFNSANSGNGNPPYGFCYGPSRNPPYCSGSFNPSNCNAFCCSGPFPTWSPYCGSFNPSFCSSYSPVVCNGYSTFSCNCVTEHRISFIRSLAGTITMLSNNLFSTAVQSFKIFLSGEQATLQSFSSVSYSSQIGEPVVIPLSSPQKTVDHGIIKSTSSYQQGSSIDEFGVI